MLCALPFSPCQSLPDCSEPSEKGETGCTVAQHGVHTVYTLVFISSPPSSSGLAQMSPGDGAVTAVARVHIHVAIKHPLRLRLIGPWLLPDDDADKGAESPQRGHTYEIML